MLMTKCLVMEFTLIPDIFIDTDYEHYADGLTKRNGVNSKVSRQQFRTNEMVDDRVKSIGLLNEGTTCYINSLL